MEARTLGALILFLGLTTTLVPAPATAQRTPNVPDSAALQRRYPLARFGKWVTLGSAVASATYGVMANQDADNRYADLERTCLAEPFRCTRTTGGSYADPILESEYQRILKLDSKAHIALVAGEISLLASVLLFVIDLPKGKTAEDIPYSPPKFQVQPDRDRLLFVLRLGGR
ncbi:MAG: hypothetical protein ACREMA_04405 [Longimicrobiales bacterium]